MEAGLTRAMQALSDPTRRAILKLLNDTDLSAGDIAARFDISAPSISHHLNVLKHAELVAARRNGQNIIYRLNTTVLHEMLQQLMDMFGVGEKELFNSKEQEDA